MAALVCGSLAFDSIADFPGRFAEQILPNQLHVLNVSFLVPTLRRDYGGCAGNIAYNLARLGGEPVVVAAVGNDGAEYVERLRSWGLTTDLVKTIAGSYTAQAFIITDLDNNQITAFHRARCSPRTRRRCPSATDIRLAIIAPDGRDAMLEHARQLRRRQDPVDLLYRARPAYVRGRRARSPSSRSARLGRRQRLRSEELPAERTGRSIEAMSRSHLRGVVVTLGALRLRALGAGP